MSDRTTTSELHAMLAETTAQVIARTRGDFASDWALITEAGLDRLMLTEAEGGFGGGWPEAALVLRLAGASALALPLGEVMLARRLAAQAGFDDARLPLIGASAAGRLSADGLFTGTLPSVPWGRHASHVLAVCDGRLMQLDCASARIVWGENPAGEPRDTLHCDRAPAETAPAIALFANGALLRVLQAVGALTAARDLSVSYVNTRQQFGRALANFQAVQQLLSQFAVEVAAVEAAASGAVAAAALGDAGFEIAAAKLRTNLAIGLCTAAAHQVHGAIGFTADYALHPLTRRLWSWRSEFGHDGHWADQLASWSLSHGAEGFWPVLAARGDSVAAQY